MDTIFFSDIENNHYLFSSYRRQVTDVSPFPDEKGGYVLTVGLSSETVERCKAVLSQIKGTDGTAKIIIKERTLLECFFSFN